ncbi:hypothetical protein FBU30_002545, partial [Linnemannia zychae]
MSSKFFTRVIYLCTVVLLLLHVLVATTPKLVSAQSCSKYFEGCDAGLTCCPGLYCKFSDMYGKYCENEKKPEPQPVPKPQPKPIPRPQPKCKAR